MDIRVTLQRVTDGTLNLRPNPMRFFLIEQDDNYEQHSGECDSCDPAITLHFPVVLLGPSSNPAW